MKERLKVSALNPGSTSSNWGIFAHTAHEVPCRHDSHPISREWSCSLAHRIANWRDFAVCRLWPSRSFGPRPFARRLSGSPLIGRAAIGHALKIKAVARRFAREQKRAALAPRCERLVVHGLE